MKERESTEAEAIELIKNQVAELDSLRNELILKDQEIQTFKHQIQQADSYKEQILTLRRQVQICEEKIKFYDRENNIKSEQIVEKAKFASTIEKELNAEMQELEERLGAALDTSQKKSERVGELERKITLKEKKNKEIKREIDRMGERVVSLQNSQRVKDEENIKKFQKFENQMKEMLADKRRSQERMRLLNKQVDELNGQIQSAGMKEKEMNDTLRNRQRENKQLKEENNKLHSLLEQLSLENSSVASLRQKASQLDNYVVNLTEQFQMERRRFEEMNYEKERIEGELKELQIKYLGPGSGANSMEGLKALIVQLETQLEEVRKRSEDQGQEMRNKESQILEMQNEQRELQNYVSSELESVKMWIDTYISNSHFYEEKIEESGESRRSGRGAGKRKKEGVISVYEGLINEVRWSLKDARMNACARFKELSTQLDKMKQELWETNILKNEIIKDLGRFKSSIGEQESHLTEMKLEKERLRERCAERQSEIERQKGLRMEEAANNRALLLDFYHALNCVREKFENVEYVRRQMNLEVEAKAEESPTAAVSEVIALIGDITNLQSFEIKSLQVRLMDLDESKQNWEQNKGELYEELERLEKMKQEEVKKLEEAYNAKYAQFRNISGDLERTIRDLTEELEQTRVKMVHSSQEQQLLEERVQTGEEKSEKMSRLKDLGVQIAMGLVLRVEELIEEKRMLLKMVENAGQREEFQKREIMAMFERYKIEETLGGSGKEVKRGGGGRVLRVLKFRKCVIAVIAALRFKKARHFGVSLRKVSENLQELRSITEGGGELSDENFDSLNLDLRTHSRTRFHSSPPHATLALRNVFKRMQFITLPGLKRLEEVGEDQHVVKECIEGDGKCEWLEQLWTNIGEFVQELRTQEASYEKGMARSTFQNANRRGGLGLDMQRSELIPQHETVIGLVAQSSLCLKHKVLESEIQPGSFEKARMKWLERAFCWKKGFRHNMEKVEKFLARIDAQSQEIFKTFKNIEKERGVLHERTGRLVLENKGVLEELHRAKDEVEELRSERKGFVRPETYSSLEEKYEEKIRENEGLSRKSESFAEKERELTNQLSRVLSEKKDLHEEKMLLQAKQRHLEREIELKEAQMGSVQQMLQTRESEIQGVQQSSQSMSFEKQGLLQKMSELEHEREKLIKDNVFLISQNELFSKKIEELKVQESKIEASGQAQMREYVELVQFYNQKATKYEEIAKLQETNMKALEERCKMLEFEHRQQQQLQQQGKSYLPVASSYERNLMRSSSSASASSFKHYHQAETGTSSTVAGPTFMHEMQTRNEPVLDLSKSSIPTAQSINFESLQLPCGISGASGLVGGGHGSESVEITAGGVGYEEGKRKENDTEVTPPMKERSSRFHFGGGVGGGDMPSEIKEQSPSVEYGDKETPSNSSRTKHSYESSAKIPGKIARIKNS